MVGQDNALGRDSNLQDPQRDSWEFASVWGSVLMLVLLIFSF